MDSNYKVWDLIAFFWPWTSKRQQPRDMNRDPNQAARACPEEEDKMLGWGLQLCPFVSLPNPSKEEKCQQKLLYDASASVTNPGAAQWEGETLHAHLLLHGRSHSRLRCLKQSGNTLVWTRNGDGDTEKQNAWHQTWTLEEYSASWENTVKSRCMSDIPFYL